MTYDRAWIEREYRTKTKLKFLHFWSHQPSMDGRLTTSCFSQWWPARFMVGDDVYPTAEHWMMAAKARLFSDRATLARILAAGSPKQAKEFGRQVGGFDEATWDAHKVAIVTEGSLHKFHQNPGLRDFLLATGDKVLVEASPVDRIWGIGLAADDKRARNPLQWRGENLLGFALMDVRDRLRT
jgi:ribA/ribD-fused uncharacterized protein